MVQGFFVYQCGTKIFCLSMWYPLTKSNPFDGKLFNHFIKKSSHPAFHYGKILKIMMATDEFTPFLSVEKA